MPDWNHIPQLQLSTSSPFSMFDWLSPEYSLIVDGYRPLHSAAWKIHYLWQSMPDDVPITANFLKSSSQNASQFFTFLSPFFFFLKHLPIKVRYIQKNYKDFPGTQILQSGMQVLTVFEFFSAFIFRWRACCYDFSSQDGCNIVDFLPVQRYYFIFAKADFPLSASPVTIVNEKTSSSYWSTWIVIKCN